jgi:hypothetical protein
MNKAQKISFAMHRWIKWFSTDEHSVTTTPSRRSRNVGIRLKATFREPDLPGLGNRPEAHTLEMSCFVIFIELEQI